MKKWKKTILFLLIAAVLFLGGGYAAYKGYRHVRQVRLVKQAKGYLEKSQDRQAVLSLQRALKFNSRDVEATRLMAELAERAGSQSALLWRSKVVALNPQSTDDRLALTRTAMIARDLLVATNALEGVTAEGKKTAGYQNIAGTVAAAMNQVSSAESHFLEAARLEPTNPVPVLNLSVVRLQSTNSQVLAEARTALRQLAATPAHRCQALRELLGDAIRHDQTNDALTLSRDLVQQTNSLFRDKIMRLNVLKVTANPAFKPTLAAYQRDAATNAASAYEMANWLMTSSGPADALAWLHTFPLSTQTNQPAALQIAQCQTALKDWRSLQATLSKQFWGDLELVRHAYLARAMRGQDLLDSSKTEWEQALKAANGTKEGMVMLLRMAAVWDWGSESEELLWSIFNRYPAEKWAFQTLLQVLYNTGRTRPLMTLFSQESKRNPADLSLKNNLAMTAMLLEAQELKPFDLAREVYEKAPTNSSFVGTYAFSLHLQKKNAEALQLMQKIPAKDLERPSTAGYYGVILTASGNKQKAKPYLDLAAKGPMLPEEKKLFDRARSAP